MTYSTIIELRRRYRDNDMSQDGGSPAKASPRCKCGNLLTISDSNYRCRECRVSGVK